MLVRTQKTWARPPELDAAKKTSKTGLASLKPAGGFSFFLFKLILYYFFLSTPSSSLPFFPVLFFFLSLYISSSSLLLLSFLIPKSEIIKLRTMKRPELDPKRGHLNS